MFINLFWKEARENLWKLGFCLSVGLAFTALLLRVRIIPDWSVCMLISWVQLFVVPVVYALDIFSGEMSNRTIHLLFKVPTQRWKIFLSKYLIVMLEMTLIFVLTGLAMEGLGHGREVDRGLLLKTSLLFGACAQLLFAWFCVFGCQSRNEAGSLVAMFGVMIGWGIVLLWAGLCKVPWAMHFVPYGFPLWATGTQTAWMHLDQLVYSQIVVAPIILIIACYRFIKVRRYL